MKSRSAQKVSTSESAGHVWLLAVAGVLAAHQLVGLQRAHGLENLGFLAVHGPKAPIGWRFHGKQSDDLEKVVLDHVAQTAGGFVKRAAVGHAKGFGQGYLHAGHVVSVPDRFQEGVGKAEIEDIHDRLLAEEVVDAEDRVFREHRPRHAVKLLRRGQVSAERLFDNNARILSQFRGTEPLDHRLEEHGRNGEVVCRTLCAAPAPL